MSRRGLSFVAVVALLALAGWGLLSPPVARASPLTVCAARSVRPLVTSLEGAATEVVAFVGVVNRGPACHLRSVFSFAVTERGRLARVRTNPLRRWLRRDLAHGRTVLFDVWWSDWCGSQRAAQFSARVTLGRSRAFARYPLLPVCLSRAGSSRLVLGAG